MSIRVSALLLLSALAAVACSSASEAEKSTVSIDALTSPAANADAGPAPIDCKATATQGECVTCVSNANAAGAAVYRGLVQQAFCADDICHADCATTLCATAQTKPNAACITCALGAEEVVGQAVLTGCAADASCEAFSQGLSDAQCAAKPTN